MLSQQHLNARLTCAIWRPHTRGPQRTVPPTAWESSGEKSGASFETAVPFYKQYRNLYVVGSTFEVGFKQTGGSTEHLFKEITLLTDKTTLRIENCSFKSVILKTSTQFSLQEFCNYGIWANTLQPPKSVRQTVS